MRENNHKMTERLKSSYEELVVKLDNIQQLDAIALSLPRICAPFQFHFHDLLKEYHIAQDKQDEYYHGAMFNAKSGRSQLALINLGASEIKKMIESDEQYRKHTNILNTIQEEMKLVEEMLTTLKNFGFNISSSIKYRELIGGAR